MTSLLLGLEMQKLILKGLKLSSQLSDRTIFREYVLESILDMQDTVIVDQQQLGPINISLMFLKGINLS